MRRPLGAPSARPRGRNASEPRRRPASCACTGRADSARSAYRPPFGGGAELDGLQRDAGRLQLEEAEEEIDWLNEEVGRLTSLNDELTTRCSHMERHTNWLEQRLNAAGLKDGELLSLQEENGRLWDEVEELRAYDDSSLASENALLKRSAQTLRSKFSEMQAIHVAECSRRDQEMSSLRRQLASLKRANEWLVSQAAGVAPPFDDEFEEHRPPELQLGRGRVSKPSPCGRSPCSRSAASSQAASSPGAHSVASSGIEEIEEGAKVDEQDARSAAAAVRTEAIRAAEAQAALARQAADRASAAERAAQELAREQEEGAKQAGVRSQALLSKAGEVSKIAKDAQERAREAQRLVEQLQRTDQLNPAAPPPAALPTAPAAAPATARATAPAKATATAPATAPATDAPAPATEHTGIEAEGWTHALGIRRDGTAQERSMSARSEPDKNPPRLQPSEVKATIQLEVVEAKQLAAKDDSGASDPYCAVYAEHLGGQVAGSHV